jgi:hypothetical protein
VKSDARPDQLITFTRCLHEALPIKYRDLPSAAQRPSETSSTFPDSSARRICVSLFA